MSLFKKPASRFWQGAFTYRGTRHQFSTRVEDKHEAEGILKAKWVQLARGEVGLPPEKKVEPKTVAELLDALEKWYRSEGKASQQNLSALAVARRAFGSKTAHALTKEAIDRYIEKRIHQGAKPATVNRISEKVRRAFTLAELVPPKIQHLSEKGNVRKGFFEQAEFEAVASHLPPDLSDFARFGFLSSWRKSEIASLRWADVENNVIHLRAEDSKNREPRSIPVTGELIQVIERRRRARAFETPEGEQLSEWIFHRDGRRILEFRKAWKSACKRAGCPNKLFHDLRRTCVRDLVRAGVPQSVAMDISGHKTITVFKRYNITDQRDKVAAFQHLAEHHEKARKKVVTMAGR